MKTCIVYDSLYGNTEKIAHAIGDAIAGEVRIEPASEIKISELKDLNLLVIGSPTHGGRPTPAIQKFIKNIPADLLKNIDIATFDTRVSIKEQPRWLRLIINIFGYAAPRTAKSLQKRGDNLVVMTEGFIVDDKKGPLRKGELERAFNWGKKISNINK
jgi:flavodoxin